tara:strand:- start:267 stop:629 length:363 start_codon:yes stop_codon:yes gene_type:complete
MKLELDLIRSILHQIERSPWVQIHQDKIIEENNDYSPREVEYNLALMWDHGLITGKEAKFSSRHPDRIIEVGRITWKGHSVLSEIVHSSTYKFMKIKARPRTESHAQEPPPTFHGIKIRD